MATNLNVIIHGPDIQFDNGNHGSNPKMSVNIDIGNFTRNINSGNPSNTTATCVISSISMNQLGSPVNDGSYASGGSFFTHLLEVGARLCAHSDTSTTPSQTLFVKQRSWANRLCPESVWFGKNNISSNHTVWGKGTYNGINFKTTTGYSENPVNYGTKTDNPGSTTMTATVPVTESTIELRLYIRSGCDCHQVSGGLSANDWVKVVAVDMTSYFRLPTPTLAIKQNSSNIEVISAQETVNLVTTTSGDTPDSYVFEYAWKNPTTNTLTAYKTLSTSSTSSINFTHNADRERTDFSTQWPINLYFRVKTVKAGYTDSEYSNVVHLQTLYNPIELQSGPTITYYDQNNNLVNDYSSGFVSLSGKFRLNAVGKALSAHKGNCVSYDIKLCNRSGTVLSTVATNVSMPASNADYNLSDINESYSGNMAPDTPYKLKFLFHYQDTSVPSSSTYYNTYPSTTYDYPLEYFSGEFRLGLAPEVPYLIYPSDATSCITYSNEPKLIFKVYNPSGMTLQYPEIVNVTVTYSDGNVDRCRIIEIQSSTPELNTLTLINDPSNSGRFLSIRKGKTSSKGYMIVYKIRPFTGTWYTNLGAGSYDMNNIKIQCTNFMGVTSGYKTITHFYKNPIDLVVTGNLITANNASTLGNCCRNVLNAYSKLKNDYQDEDSSTNRIYNSYSSTQYNQIYFKNNLIYRDKVTYGGNDPTTIYVVSLWLKWLALPKSSASNGKYGILEKLASYGGVTESESFSYSQALARSSSGNLINAKNRGDNDYYFGNIYNLIVDLLLNYL